jgi:hypothetical protein
VSITRASDLLRLAEADWTEAVDAHILAEPNPQFAERLRYFAAAAERQRDAMEYAHQAGFAWDPLPSSPPRPAPYELSAGSGRVGPAAMWRRFDAAYARWDRALEQSSLQVVADGFAQVAEVAAELAEAVDDERGQGQVRGRVSG